MGTPKDDVRKLWETFDLELKTAGLSVAEFGRWYYCEVNDWEDEDEVRKFAEKLKKQRQRKETTPRMVANLTDYIQKIYLHPDYMNRTGKVPPRRPEYPELNAEFHRLMRPISNKIDEMVEDELMDEE